MQLVESDKAHSWRDEAVMVIDAAAAAAAAAGQWLDDSDVTHATAKLSATATATWLSVLASPLTLAALLPQHGGGCYAQDTCLLFPINSPSRQRLHCGNGTASTATRLSVCATNVCGFVGLTL